jgi:hypothetical protein
MINIPGAEEIGKTTRSFFEVLRESPLSLALVAVIAGLVVLLYYSQANTLEQRRETSNLIISWQRDTDKLMANCVSQDVTKMMMDNIQTVTKTMLDTAQTDITRMQTAIDKEREINRQMIERLIPAPRPQQFFPQGRPIEYEACDPLGPYCGPVVDYTDLREFDPPTDQTAPK